MIAVRHQRTGTFAVMDEWSDIRPLRVAVVEDDRITREALAELLANAPGYACVGTFRSIEEALAGPSLQVQVALVDIDLPGIPGSKGVRLLRDHWPGCEVVMLTVYPDANRVFESICNGAVGYLLKKTPARRLLDAIREGAAGGAPLSPEIARQVVTTFRAAPSPPLAAGTLTAQETLVLQLLADGYSYGTVASRMSISVNTVRTYIRNVYEKLHVHTKSEAVSQGLRRGLIR
jgi:DNA-binding NarL/FixJ family response regulator